MHKIENLFVTMLQTKVRKKQTGSEELKEALFQLGEYMCTEIIGNEFLESECVITPLDEQFHGLIMIQPKTMIISTKDDYEYFAAGISKNLNNCLRGYMDFAGLKGVQTLSSSIRSVSLPEINNGEIIDTIIIAKSVLATGCTAISLLKKAIEVYNPSNIIVASVFYSNQGVLELKMKMPKCKIYVCGDADSINKDGMLVPGIGNLDKRLSASNA